MTSIDITVGDYIFSWRLPVRHAQDAIVITNTSAISEANISAVYTAMVTQGAESYISESIYAYWEAGKVNQTASNIVYAMSHLYKGGLYVAVIIPQIVPSITATATNAITRTYETVTGSIVTLGPINLIFGWVSGTAGTYAISGIEALCLNLGNTLSIQSYEAVMSKTVATLNTEWMGL